MGYLHLENHNEFIELKALDWSLSRAPGYVVLGGDNVLPVVEIGLADLIKTGGGGMSLGPPSCDKSDWTSIQKYVLTYCYQKYLPRRVQVNGSAAGKL